MLIYINRILYYKSGDTQEVWRVDKECGDIILTGCRNYNENFGILPLIEIVVVGNILFNIANLFF